jgi:NEDD8-activating enzyme E1 regulatory subunit
MTTSISSTASAPKTDKYDRQLRLWGAAGQQALADTCIVLIRPSAAGTETLKNLVLPGVGSICIVDTVHAVVSPQDAAGNFFLPSVAICHNDNNNSNNNISSSENSGDNGDTNNHGHCRASVALQYLQELNPDLQGDFQTVEDLRQVDWSSLFQTAKQKHNSQHLLILASDVEPPLLLAIATVCQDQSIPLLHVACYGLLGIVRVQTPVWPILQPKPRDSPPDVRLPTVHRSVPAVAALAESMDWTHLDRAAASHVPYPLVLYRAFHVWQMTHATNETRINNVTVQWKSLPTTFAEKQEFQASIAALAYEDFLHRSQREWSQRHPELSVDASLFETKDMSLLPSTWSEAERQEWHDLVHSFELADNYREAQSHAYLAYTERCDDFFTDTLPRLLEIAQHNAPRFYLLLQALERFGQKHHRTPIQGTLPDMTASSQLYLQLQRIYQEQARRDVEELRTLLTPSSHYSFTDEELVTLCQNTATLDVLLIRSIPEEYNEKAPDDVTEDLVMATMEGDERPEQLPLLWYLGFRACQLFYQKYQRYPGVTDPYTPDVELLFTCLTEIVTHYGLQDVELVQSTLLDNRDYATELVRYAQAEIHTIASVVGGVASQEAVKLITGQYVPLNATYVYNGIASMGGVYRF